MKGSTVWNAKRIGVDRTRSIRPIAAIAVFALAIISAPRSAVADEGGVSFWVPGFFGSLAAAPQQPGWTLTSFYYHTSVSAGGDVARAREFETGRIAVNLTANVSASLQARADLGFLMPTYTFATAVFGGQLTVGAIGTYGQTSTSLAGSVTGALATPLGTLPFSRFDSISDSVSGFGDVLPIATLRWNNGVHNYMTYITGDIPVGAYDSTRLSNIGIGQTARSTPAAATPISIHRPGTSSRACSASPTISRTNRPHIRMASTCISIGARRNS